ncbi:MAG: DUF4019 domain-containing protein [Desulfobacteraceae bacterium]|nr:MAG: DUF4019 domain-containing protein [Desulfobacteraceae bacterium]
MFRTCILVLLLILLPLNPLIADTRQSKAEAVTSALAWLSLVDSGEYEDSWNTSATYFKAAVTADQWQQTLTAVRKPLGALNSRAVKSAAFHTSLPGAPDGEYVVIQFSTSFANKASATETVTPVKEKDGTWRVTGYYIQ